MTACSPIHYWIGVMAPFDRIGYSIPDRHTTNAITNHLVLEGTEPSTMTYILAQEVAELLGQAMTSCTHMSSMKWRDQEALHHMVGSTENHRRTTIAPHPHLPSPRSLIFILSKLPYKTSRTASNRPRGTTTNSCS